MKTLPCLYLPPISTMAFIAQHKTINITLHEKYEKGTLRNTTRIAGPNGIQYLTIPVKKNRNSSLKDIQIAYDEDWKRMHLRSISTAYGRSPFFEYYISGLEKAFYLKSDLLWEFNLALLRFVLLKLQIDTSIQIIEHNAMYKEEMTNHPINLPFGEKIKNISNTSLDPYPQVFEYKYGWINNLSILDLLFCMGPAGKQYLLDQRV